MSDDQQSQLGTILKSLLFWATLIATGMTIWWLSDGQR